MARVKNVSIMHIEEKPAVKRNIVASKVPRSSPLNVIEHLTKVKRKIKRGSVALREIKKIQASNDLIIPRKVILRVTKEIMQDLEEHYDLAKHQISSQALDALREGTEDYIVQIIKNCQFLSSTFNKETINRKAFRIAKAMGWFDLPSYCKDTDPLDLAIADQEMWEKNHKTLVENAEDEDIDDDYEKDYEETEDEEEDEEEEEEEEEQVVKKKEAPKKIVAVTRNLRGKKKLN